MLTETNSQPEDIDVDSRDRKQPILNGNPMKKIKTYEDTQQNGILRQNSAHVQNQFNLIQALLEKQVIEKTVTIQENHDVEQDSNAVIPNNQSPGKPSLDQITPLTESRENIPQKIVSKIDLLIDEKSDLEQRLGELKKSVNAKYDELKKIKDQCIELPMKYVEFDDLFEVVTKSQIKCRDAMNAIYKPGKVVLDELIYHIDKSNFRTENLLTELKIYYETKFEKIDNNIKQRVLELEHRRDCLKRSILTLKTNLEEKLAKESEIMVANEVVKEGKIEKEETVLIEAKEEAIEVDVEKKQNGNGKSVNFSDEDCIVIELKDDQVCDLREKIETHEPRAKLDEIPPNSGGESSSSIELDSELTDIENEEVSFTPLQAQRTEKNEIDAKI